MEVRVQYTNYENDEFESLGFKTLSAVLQIFKEYPWESEVNKIKDLKESVTYPSIKIINKKKEYIFINGFLNNGEIFFNIRVKYKSKSVSRTITGLKYDYEKCLQVISNFYEKDILTVVRNIKVGRVFETPFLIDLIANNTRDNDKIIESSHNKEIYYKYTFAWKKVISKSFLTFVFLITPIILLLFINKSSLGVYIFLQIFFGLLAFPGIILIINHIYASRDIQVFFQKNNDRFIIINSGIKKDYNKALISEIIINNCTLDRAPWNDFTYSEIIFENRDSIKISNIIIDDILLIKHFGKVPQKTEKSFIPII